MSSLVNGYENAHVFLFARKREEWAPIRILESTKEGPKT